VTAPAAPILPDPDVTSVEDEAVWATAPAEPVVLDTAEATEVTSPPFGANDQAAADAAYTVGPAQGVTAAGPQPLPAPEDFAEPALAAAAESVGEPELEVPAKPEPEARPVTPAPQPKARVDEAPAVAPASGATRSNPWIGLLWVVAGVALAVGMPLGYFASDFLAYLGNVVASLGSLAVVGALVLAGLDRRLRDR